MCGSDTRPRRVDGTWWDTGRPNRPPGRSSDETIHVVGSSPGAWGIRPYRTERRNAIKMEAQLLLGTGEQGRACDHGRQDSWIRRTWRVERSQGCSTDRTPRVIALDRTTVERPGTEDQAGGFQAVAEGERFKVKSIPNSTRVRSKILNIPLGHAISA